MAIKDKSTLQEDKDAALASGQPGGITAEAHRGVVGDDIDSAANLAELSLQTFAGPINFLDRVNMFGNGGVVPIYSASDIPTPSGIPTFSSGVTYQIQESIPDWPTQGVLMEDGAACVDLNMLNNVITMAGTGTMFYGSGNVYLSGLVLDCPDGQFYDFEDPVGGQKICIIERNQNLTCSKIGTFDNHAITVIDFFKVDDADQGFTFTGNNKLVQSISRAAITTTVGAGFVAVDQTNITTVFLEYSVHVLNGPAGSIAYRGAINSGNMAPGSVGSIEGCEIVGGMTVLDGISGDDVGYRFTNTLGVDDSTVLGAGYVIATIPTPISNGVDTVLLGTYAQSAGSTQATISAAGTITTLNRIPSKAIAEAVMVVDKLAGGTDTYRFVIQRDAGGVGTWVEIPESVKVITTQGAETPDILLRGPTRAEINDQFRIVVRGVGTNDDITLQSNVFTVEKV